MQLTPAVQIPMLTLVSAISKIKLFPLDTVVQLSFYFLDIEKC